MSNPNLSLMKTCNSCGKQKPLSAFLQLSGKEGSTYGNICSTCRKAGMGKPNIEPDESTRQGSGVVIDSKAKATSDSDKKLFRQETEERYHEERDLDEEKETVRIEKIVSKQTSEKEHREGYLKKGSFLDNTKQKQQTLSPQNPEELAILEKQTDLANPFIDTQISGKLKYGAEFNRFLTWIGDTPIARAARQAMQNTKQNPAANNKNTKETLSEQIKKTLGPGSKNR